METDEAPSILRLKHCPACSYDLRGLREADRCPECGAELGANLIDLPVWTERSRRFRNWSLMSTGLVVVAMFLAMSYFKFNIGCIFLLVVCYGGTLIMRFVRHVQIRRADPNVTLLFRDRDMAVIEHGKTLLTIPFENLILMNQRPQRNRWRFKVTDRRWFKSDHQFQCTAFISPEQGEELKREIRRRSLVNAASTWM